MDKSPINHALNDINQTALSRLAKLADRMLSQRGHLTSGHHPFRTRAGQGSEFFDYREYKPGDDLRSVDWHLSARHTNYYVTEHCDDVHSDWIICLDNSASMLIQNGEKLQSAIQLSAAFCYLLLHLGNRVSIAVYSDEINQYYPLGRGPHHFSNIVNFLGQIQGCHNSRSTRLLSCINKIPRKGDVVIISDFLETQSGNSDLIAFRKLGNEIHTIQVLSSKETSLPDNRVLTIVDAENGQERILNSSEPIQLQARQNLDQFVDQTSKLCSSLGFLHSSCYTKQSWYEILTAHILKYRFSRV